MNRKKISILAITFVLTIVIFVISTHIQKELINYEPQVNCLILNQDILANQRINEDMFSLKSIPLSLVNTVSVVTSYDDIDGLYAKDNILKSQIAMRNQFDTKENLSIYEVEQGKEKISIKISSPENGLSYAIKQNSKICLYATFRSDYAKDFSIEKARLTVGDEYDGYTVIKLIDSVQILGVFNVDGIEVKSYEDGNIDSVMIAVTPEDAKEINLLREIATFSITGLADEYMSNENTQESIEEM